MVSKQDTFNTVVAHLRAQGCKSLSASGIVCRYRAENGLKCAVGALLPDSEYKSWFDSGNLILSEVYAACPSLQAHSLDLLTDLQRIHDSSEVEKWEANLESLAASQGLEYTAP